MVYVGYMFMLYAILLYVIVEFKDITCVLMKRHAG